jgi:hypothetical protein
MILMWQKDMDLGFQCERGVFCCRLGTVIQLLSYCIVIYWSTLMGRFSANDNHAIKKVQRIRDYCYFIYLFLMWWRMVRMMELDRDAILQEMSGFPS